MKTKRLLAILLSSMLVIAAIPLTTAATEIQNPLHPNHTFAENSKIELSKSGVRTAEDEWDVTLTVKTDLEIKQVPVAVAFVLDTSKSMEATDACPENHTHSPACNRLSIAIDAANDLLNRLGNALGSNLTTKLVEFSIDARNVSGSAYPAQSAFGYLAGTDLIAGFNKGVDALNISELAGAKKYIIVLTDGEPNRKPSGSGESTNFPVNASNAFRAAGGKVYTVAFKSNIAGLTQIADQTYTANNYSGLQIALDSISTQITAMVVDPMGANLAAQGAANVTGALPAIATLKNSNTHLEWTPQSGKLGPDSSVTITYKVKLDPTSIPGYLGQDKAVPLNGDAKLNYLLSTETQEKSLGFPLPKDYIDVGKLDVAYRIGGTSTPVPGAPTFPTQYKITDWDVPAHFTVGSAYLPIEITSGEDTYEFKNATYDGSPIALAEAASIPATHSAHLLILNYELKTDPEPEPGRYSYSVKRRYVLQGSDPEQVIGSVETVASGALEVGDTDEITVLPGTVPGGYTLAGPASELVPIAQPAEGGDFEKLVTFYVTKNEGEPEPEPTPPIYIPPQILIPTPTPTPPTEPEIEIPPEDIPTAEEPEIDQGGEDFDDEEIPTDVPKTGEASLILPAALLSALAGAAFVLAAKKSGKEQ